MTSTQTASKASIDLFTPVQVGPYRLPNRLVMAPCTRNRAGAGNVPVPLNALYYEQRAGAGLIITEATQVCTEGQGYPLTPGIHTPEQVRGWRQVVSGVHRLGGKIFLQLWHVGRVSHPSFQPGGGLPVAPTALAPEGFAVTFQGFQPFVTPRALETAEIPEVVEQYRQGAIHAKAAGFDGVEIHAANGYLIDQFLRDGTNRRKDLYGGSVQNRVRFLLEVTQAVTSVWGDNRVGIRLSPAGGFNSMHDSDPQVTFGYAVQALNNFNLAYLHVVEFVESVARFDFVKLRQQYKGLYMANGGYDRNMATAAIKEGRVDLVSFGQAFIANPDLPRRFAENLPLNPADPGSFYGGTHEGYTDYPAWP